jgi:hypothetical protein
MEVEMIRDSCKRRLFVLLGFLVLSLSNFPLIGMPLFIENVGQFDQRALFQVWGGGQTLWITSDAIWITLVEPRKPSEPREKGGLFPFREEEEKPRKAVNIRISFPGANPNARLEPFGRLDMVVSYFIGNDPAKWRVAVPVWAGVRYVNLYPGVDLEFRGEAGQVVPCLVAHPGADLSVVRVRVEGAEEVVPGRGGGLLLRTALGEFTLPLFWVEGGSAEPALVQRVDSLAFEVSHPFTAGNEAVSAPSSMVHSQQAVSILYSGFLGGSSYDWGYGIAVDSSGNAYITGWTASFDFPTVVGPDTSYNCYRDAFVTKVNPDGTALVYTGFLGGSANDGGYSIAVDSSGNAYITGWTASSDFPVVVGPYTSHNGYWDAFVAKVNPAGTALVYSGFLGGSDDDCGYGITVDSSGNTYVTGYTYSSDFPTVVGPDTTFNGAWDAFVAKVNPAGTALVYSGFLGGSGSDGGKGIVVDSSGNAYVTGYTYSSDFPAVVGPYTTFNGCVDAFVAKVNPAGTALVYSGFLGGSGSDGGEGIAVDSSGNAYVTGWTTSSDFPVVVGPDTSYNDYGDAFVAKVNPDGTALVYAGFLGGSESDWSEGIAVDSSGNAYITGYTYSSDFPAVVGPDTSYNDYGDAFVAKVNPDGTALVYAGFLGGSESDWSEGIAVDSSGNAYITGYTYSSDFPAVVGPDTSYNGILDAFVVKLSIVSPFRTGFDNLDGWTKTGLWHLQNTACFECNLMEGSFAYYAQPDGCTYAVKDKRGRSVPTWGTLTSPVIPIPKNTTLTLQFDFFREVEKYICFTLDRTYVQIRLGTSGKTLRWSSWKTIWSRSSKDPSPECNTASYTFQSKNYDRLQIRFVFDSVNGNNNHYRGWAIDNLVVKPAPTPTKAVEVPDLGLGWDVPKDFAPGEMRVLNIPNPVRDVHTTVFTVLGVEAEGIKVEVYDFTGRLVWKGEAEGNELPWDTRDLTGLPLANGVYLYLVYVKVEGEWIVSDVQKLVILR